MLADSRVVEDEALVAAGIGEMLLEAKGVLVAPASVGEGRRLIKGGAAVDAALPDVSLSDGSVIPTLEAVSARGIPIAVCTGAMVPGDVRPRHPELVTLSKPVLPARLTGKLRTAIGALDGFSLQG